MIRTKILLEPRQRHRLEELTRREGRSISDVTRRAIDASLEALEPEMDIWEKRERIISELRIVREKQPFVYHEDLVNEARQEQQVEKRGIWNSVRELGIDWVYCFSGSMSI
jgi:predicted YcjX-like family ATPase